MWFWSCSQSFFLKKCPKPWSFPCFSQETISESSSLSLLCFWEKLLHRRPQPYGKVHTIKVLSCPLAPGGTKKRIHKKHRITVIRQDGLETGRSGKSQLRIQRQTAPHGLLCLDQDIIDFIGTSCRSSDQSSASKPNGTNLSLVSSLSLSKGMKTFTAECCLLTTSPLETLR